MGGTLAAWGGLFATILAPLGYIETQSGRICIDRFVFLRRFLLNRDGQVKSIFDLNQVKSSHKSLDFT